MRNEVKTGDKLVAIGIQGLDDGKSYTVKNIDYHYSLNMVDVSNTRVSLVEDPTGEYYNVEGFMKERDFVEMSINGLIERGIGVGPDEPDPKEKCYLKDSWYSIDGILDKLYPTECPQQTELKKLEKQQQELADKIESLRREIADDYA